MRENNLVHSAWSLHIKLGAAQLDPGLLVCLIIRDKICLAGYPNEQTGLVIGGYLSSHASG